MFNNQADVITYYLGGGIHSLCWLSCQILLHEVTKTVGTVMRTWACCCNPHFMESMIIELVITVLSPSYSILLFILCKVESGGGGGGRVTKEKYNWK